MKTPWRGIVHGVRRQARRVLAASAGLVLLGVGALVATAAWRGRLASPPPTVLLRDRSGAFLAEVDVGTSGELGYWPVKALPTRVVAATVALEDRRFWSHPGVDLFAVARAAVQNVRSRRRVSGASTLAMQVARMQNPGGRSYIRKATEALTGFFLTARYGREAVLAQYLRLAPFGNRLHGIAYAARRYLNKPVEDLSWAEIAFMAALPQAPSRMNPFDSDGKRRAVARGKRLLGILHGQGVVSASEYELAIAQIETLDVPARETRPVVALHEILRIEDELRTTAGRGWRGPLELDSTIDLALQGRVADMVADSVTAWEERGAGNAAVIVVDRRTREVRASVASTGYFDGTRRGAIDYTRVPRSPGSTLKPFLYALALELGAITPATIVDDLNRGPGGIVNADEEFLGPLLPRVALANSRNVPAVDLLARMGIDEGFAFLHDLGLHDGRLPARFYGLGLAVGGMPVTLERLVRAYTALANEGALDDLVRFLPAPATRPRRVMREDTARLITLFLSDPLARLPSFPRMGASEYPFPVAVKTGTSPDLRDAWAVAYSTRYLVGVWVGRPDFRPMSGLTGYTGAAHLARRVLVALHADQRDGLADLSFPPPEGFRSVRICALTGNAASPLCDRVFTEWFRPGSEPAAVCAAHIRVAIDTRTGGTASSRTPARFTDSRTYTRLPARYAAWAAAHGVPRLPSEMENVALGRAAPGAPPQDLGPTRGSAPRQGRSSRIRLHISAPRNGSRLLRDPETPVGLDTLALQAIVEPRTQQLVWYVDGRPFKIVDYPYVARWPLLAGVHRFQVRVPFTGSASPTVLVTVQ